MVKNEIVGGLWLFISIFVRGDNKNLQIDMKNLPLIEVTELIKGIESSDNFQDDLSIADLNGDLINYEEKRLEHSTPMRLNALLMILVQEGTADISVDYIPYKIEKNTFITLMPTHIIQVSKVSKDLRGRLLIVSRSFLDGYTTPAGKKNSMVHYMQIRKNPCAAMSAEETEHISGQFSILREKMKLRTHFFQKEALQNALVGFFIELANIFMGKKELMTAPTLSRKEELFEQFLQLLFEHCKEQHFVTVVSVIPTIKGSITLNLRFPKKAVVAKKPTGINKRIFKLTCDNIPSFPEKIALYDHKKSRFGSSNLSLLKIRSLQIIATV